MSRHDDRVSVRQMLDHAQRGCAMAHGRTREDLDSDYTFQLALTRLVEMIGEAASRVSMPTREKHPGIPWSDIVGMRNRLIHGYDVVDLNLLWDTASSDLPPLIEAPAAIVGEGE